MKAALHRSITFWSGLLVMGFVCWAWWDSLTYESLIHWREHCAANVAGGIQTSRDSTWNSTFGVAPPPPDFGTNRAILEQRLIILIDEAKLKGLKTPFFIRAKNPGTPDRLTTYQDNVAMMMQFRKPSDWEFFVPHWLILLTVAAVWLGLLFWRARRRSLGGSAPD